MTRLRAKDAFLLVCMCCLIGGCAMNLTGEPNHVLTAGSRLRIAEAAEAAGDHQAAASMYLAAVNDAPTDSAVQLQSAEGLARNNRLDSAEGILQRRLKANPRDLDLLRTLGTVQVMAGEPQLGLQSFSKVLTNRPDDIRAMVDMAVALDMLHRHAEAQGLYGKALAKSPDDAAVSNDLALSLLLSGRPAEARRLLAPFATAAGLPERIRTNLAIMDAAAGRPADARALLGSKLDAADLATLTQAIGRASVGGAGQQ